MTSRKSNDAAASYLHSIERTESRMTNKSFAESGSHWHPTSDSGLPGVEGNWCAIQGIASAIVDVSACEWAPDNDNMGSGQASNIRIPDGAIVYLNATKIVMQSGAAIFYKKPSNT